MHLRLFIGCICCLGLSVLSARGDSAVASYSYGMSDFVENAGGTEIYAIVSSENSIAVINPSTLTATLVGIGSNPYGLALSMDGSKLYVADQGSNFIAVLNTATNTTLSPISLGSGVNPLDVQVGSNNRLWVLTGAQNQFDGIEQIDATTGASTGPGPSGFIYGGAIRTSPDGNTLYYGDFGTSPSYQYQYNVSGTTPATVWSPSLGYNGEAVDLSHDGTLVAFPQGGNPSTPIIQTSSDLTLGSVGGSQALAFSPDDAFAYTDNSYSGQINVFNLSTYLQTATISTANYPGPLFVDNTGKYIFADEGGSTEVFSTGRAVPEPGCIGLAGFACVALLRRRGPQSGIIKQYKMYG
jgi:YVTN family beta-propeller protein